MKPIAASRIAAGLLLPAMLSLFTLHAETVKWSELPGMTNQQDAGYSVVTKTGHTFRGRQLVFNPLGVFVAGSGSFISQEKVAAIRIRHHGSWKEALFTPAAIFLVGTASMLDRVAIVLLLPVCVGVTAATAPFTLATEGVRRLLPARVIKIAP